MKRTLPPHKSQQSKAARISKSPQKGRIEKQKHNPDVNHRATFRNWPGTPKFLAPKSPENITPIKDVALIAADCSGIIAAY